jgi:hypothetical protein
MDNRQNFQPNMTLPPLGGETTIRSDNKNTLVSDQQETITLQSNTDKTQLPSLDFTAINFAPQSQPVNSSAHTTSQPSTPSSSLDDNSSIPKEWILKAKKIINSTISDPRQQNLEINKLKAEYMKQRFNIDIKIPNDD